MAKAETPSGVALERSPSHLLHRALQHALDIYVEQTGGEGPTQRQFAVLSAVAVNEGLTQTDLVRATGIDRSTLADLVARMIGKGLLARERSATDGRANTVRLTEAGRAALRQAQPKVKAADDKILSLVPVRARESFLSVLLSMSEAAERGAAGVDGALADGDGKKKPKAEAKRDASMKSKAAKPAKGQAAKGQPTKGQAKPDKKKKKKKSLRP
jgi:MarR family transcriptional regulator, temperature-dependent positive regulator of motility